MSFLKKIASKDINYEKTFYIGKSLQTGNPTPENPIPIVNITGTNGVITFSNDLIFTLDNGQKLYEDTEFTPNGIKNYRKQVILTGLENWTKVALSGKSVFQIVGGAFPLDVALRTASTKAYSNCYKFKYYESGITGSIQNFEFSWSGLKYLTMRNDSIASLEDWQDYLTNNSIVIEYDLNEPEIIEYTTEQEKEYLKLCRKFKNETNLNEYIV